MVRGSPHRNRIGVGRPNAFHRMCPKNIRLPLAARSWSPPAAIKFKSNCELFARENAAASGGRRRHPLSKNSAVAQAVGSALPLVDVVGDHARRLHCGLAELGVARDLALDTLAFGMQQVAQALEFRDQLLDFRKRSAGDALDQRVDVVDGRFRLRIGRCRLRARNRRPAQIGDIVANELADAFLDLRDGGKVTVGRS